MTYCPINPMDYINAPYGAFLKDVRRYDPDYGRKNEKKQEFVIEYKETRAEISTHRTTIEAYSYEEARRKILNDDSDGFIDDEEIDCDVETDYDDFKEISREEI